MQTVLLADDERVFKALEGTCLRREACRLVKAETSALAETARASEPDLIVMALDGEESWRALETISRDESLGATPVIALEYAAGRPGSKGVGGFGWKVERPAVVDRLAAGRGARGRRPADLEKRLDEAIKRHLPLLNRKVDRLSVSLPVRCRGEAGVFTVRTKNISPSGLFLKTDRDLAPGDRFMVRFALPGETAPPGRGRRGAGGPGAAISARCEVVRRVGPGGNDDHDLIPGVGVRFIDIPEDGRTVLQRFIRSGEAPAGRAGRVRRETRSAH